MRLLLLLNLFATVYSSSEENKNVEDPFLRQGDIMMTPDQLMARGSSQTVLWPNGVLIYEFSPTFEDNSDAVKAATAAMSEWMKSTCIRFKKRTTETDYVSFVIKNGCYSYVGKVGQKQELSLGKLCHYKGTAIHEIGHALGLHHEQARPDRDNYVIINFANIQKGKEHNFEKETAFNSYGTKYDYTSIMHYGAKYFSKNGLPTIVPKKQGVTLGQRNNLSFIDIKQARLAYRCQGDVVNYGYGCSWKITYKCWRYCDSSSPNSGSWCWTKEKCGTGTLGLSKGTCPPYTALLPCSGSCGTRK